MKTITTTAIVALLTTSIGLGALAPVLAQDATTTPPAQTEQATTAPDAKAPGFRPGNGGPGPRQAGALGGLFGFARGAEGVEIALVRLSHAIEMTDAQQTLFDTLKTDALAAAAQFETATEGLRPAAPAAGETPVRPDIAERLENRIALESAQLAALEAVQPAFAAFFDSLTDEQKAELTPDRPAQRQFGERHGGPGQNRHQDGGQRPMPRPGVQAPAANG
ncbi:MAG: Spy/CpxP family protein refolding chaperone [Devosia sp.]|uniref:Spy/CpxP family protein refolding chaperone n=1 Tax=Devosia sp. TaxID=1871048 RepID=UPI0024CAAAC4|nr:Spy/CpxP family protein refolding chaperone [Devosia sp.]UYO00977.1 MAG: Spy/CpxP family protein refolding chaperone [Devosia sp.]